MVKSRNKLRLEPPELSRINVEDLACQMIIVDTDTFFDRRERRWDDEKKEKGDEGRSAKKGEAGS